MKDAFDNLKVNVVVSKKREQKRLWQNRYGLANIIRIPKKKWHRRDESKLESSTMEDGTDIQEISRIEPNEFSQMNLDHEQSENSQDQMWSLHSPSPGQPMREESPNPELYRNQSMKDSLVKEDTLEDSSVKRVSTFYEKNASDFSGFEGRVIQERFQENPEESE